MGQKKMLWSKLQKSLYNLIAKDAKFQIHCAVYELGTWGNEMQRYWITIDKDIIWDFPKDFKDMEMVEGYPYQKIDIANIIRDYINTPLAEIKEKVFENDYYGLADILRKYDRRIK